MRDADIKGIDLTIGSRNIIDLRYSDDTALVWGGLVQKVDMTGWKSGRKLNAKKKWCTLKEATERTILLRLIYIPLENVEHFKYLGSIKSHNSFCSKDIYARIGLIKNWMLQLTSIWKCHNIPISLTIKILEYLIWPVLLYGSEAWAQKKVRWHQNWSMWNVAVSMDAKYLMDWKKN